MGSARQKWEGFLYYSNDFFSMNHNLTSISRQNLLTHLFGAHNGDAVCVSVCVRASCGNRSFGFDDVVFLGLLVIVLIVF